MKRIDLYFFEITIQPKDTSFQYDQFKKDINNVFGNVTIHDDNAGEYQIKGIQTYVLKHIAEKRLIKIKTWIEKHSKTKKWNITIPHHRIIHIKGVADHSKAIQTFRKYADDYIASLSDDNSSENRKNARIRYIDTARYLSANGYTIESEPGAFKLIYTVFPYKADIHSITLPMEKINFQYLSEV